MASISIRKLFKQFGSTPVIRGIDIDIRDGEFVALVGPSGCGKSTLLRVIAGLETAEGGDILLGDRRINDTAPRDRDVAMVFQNYALYPHMTVAQNLGFGLKIQGIAKDQIARRVQQAADTLGLGELLQRHPRQLSGGQRQRVAMGRAIVRQPQVFLFDEPLSNLDAKLRAQTRIEIQKLHRELGITSLFVTHDQVEAMTLAQRMVVMNGGVMEQFGTPEEVYTRPASTFVASFMGSPPMNLLKAAPNASLGGPPGATLGVRPEHFQLGTSGWALQVETTEMLGAERLVYARLGDELLIIRTDESTPAPALGSTIHATPRPDRLHWFNSETGKRLS